MDNWEVAAALERMAGLLALKGEKDFKVRAYSQAARQIIRSSEPIAEIAAAGRLRQLPGVGEALAAKINELVSTGRSAFLTALEAAVPPELLALFSIPGVGFKTAAALVEELKLNSMAQLAEAARAGQVRHLPGLGRNLELSISRYFEEQRTGAALFHRGVAVPLAEHAIAFLRGLPAVRSVCAAGDFRRGTEQVAELPLLAVLKSGRSATVLRDELRGLPGLTALVPTGERLILENVTGLPLQLTLVDEDALVTTLVERTGSAGHWTTLVQIARQHGFSLGKTGLFRNGRPVKLEQEVDLYRALKLVFIPPELREGEDEFAAAAAGKLPRLIELNQLRGDLHLHTDWSDGTASIEAMAQKGAALGYEYIAVTDHSPSLKIAGGLSEEKLAEQIASIERFNSTTPGCPVLAGAEVDIRPDGSLDLPDALLDRLDLVVASVHSSFRQTRDEMTGRICRAMEHPAVHLIGHPTGRLLGSRGGYDVDLEKLIHRAAHTGTIVEINASPQRLDLAEAYLRRARAAGVRLAVNTDAHSTVTMEDMFYGVTAARRGWLEDGDVVNTLPLAALRRALRQKRRRKG
ncbi:MAG: DNA polymerase/3'-5' exonuclease PolX [Bacillota bacterium]